MLGRRSVYHDWGMATIRLPNGSTDDESRRQSVLEICQTMGMIDVLPA
jgi:hypothetical protein